MLDARCSIFALLCACSTAPPPCPVALPPPQAPCPSVMTAAKPTVGGIPFDLPTMSRGEAQELTPIMVIGIQPDGALSLNGQPVSASALIAEARQLFNENNALRTTIAADRQADWQHVVGVMDLLKQSGIVKFAFAVEVR